jgi:hypothetical protein
MKYSHIIIGFYQIFLTSDSISEKQALIITA